MLGHRTILRRVVVEALRSALGPDDTDDPGPNVVPRMLVGIEDLYERVPSLVEIPLNGLVCAIRVTDEDRKLFLDDLVEPLANIAVQSTDVARAANEDLDHCLVRVRGMPRRLSAPLQPDPFAPESRSR